MMILKCRLTTIEAMLGTASKTKKYIVNLLQAMRPMRRAERKRLRL